MTEGHSCESCSAGCASRHTDQKTMEEVSAAPYLLAAGAIILIASVLYRWLVA
ncbi:MAG: hypothetical protein ACP5M0_13295 [Desulfomonilaceae bacterium]